MRVIVYLVTFLIFISGASQAATIKLFNCRAVAVHDNSFLSESLSVEEYPAITISKDDFDFLEATIGSAVYRQEQNDGITPLPAVGFDSAYRISPSDRLTEYEIIYNFNSDKGKLLGHRRNHISENFSELTLIADISCR